MEIPDIKTQLSITQVLTHYGLKPDKNHRLCCPFHEDSTPSLQVYEATNTCYCFSSNCKTHGKAIDQIDFVMYKEGCSKHEALLKAQSLIDAVAGPIKPAALSEEQKSSVVPVDYEILFKGFVSSLKKSPAAGAYCAKRVLNPEIGIGYNASGWAHLKHCLIFPLLDATNKVVSLYGRSIYDNESSRHFYSKDRRGLYPAYPVNYKTKLILTESVIDAATLLQITAITTQYNLLALYGTNGLTDEHLSAIQCLPGLEEVILWLNADGPGEAATRRHGQLLQTLLPGVRITRVPTPEGEDINSLAQGHGNPQLFIDLLEGRADFSFSSEPSGPIAVPPVSSSVKHTGRLDCINPDQPHYQTDHLQITLLGGVNLEYLERLRVTVYMRRNPHINPGHSIRQTVDLYQDDLLEKFTRKAAERLELPTALIAEALSELTEQLDAWRGERLMEQKTSAPVARTLTKGEQAAALSHLKNPDLMTWTMEQYQATGIVGELGNALILHQAMVSRLQEDPVSVICLSASGSGKSYLLEKVAQCFPRELLIENTQMSENSFYYFKRDEIKGKIILIEDMDGARDVEYPIRELITKKRISKTVTLKDSRGRLRTVTLTVEGPVTFCGCTTREQLYEDNANRCLLIYLDQGAEQDERIMSYHRNLRAGLIDKGMETHTREILQHMQHLLRPERVINPYAPLVELPASVFKPRRTLGLLLSFIDSITLYHQYQCTRDASGALVTDPRHIAWGLKLLRGVLFRKSDELSAPLRGFLERLQGLLEGQSQPSFYGQDIRKPLRLPPRTLSRYLYELQQYGYIRVSGGSKYRKGYEYQLIPQTESLQGSIDQHIERVMESVWAAHHRQNKVSRPVGQPSANGTLADSNNYHSIA